ncbi:hypothetical protein [Cellulomonas sp. KRMCY2]|uniref:hypothetical protein n=1 Tax=Cellulomonas sp. KRMCY2 TaxID=1304865 RepID=UPI00045E8C8F|nr:hypothetical protein [Cellulomonas sp. KRMCY2]
MATTSVADPTARHRASVLGRFALTGLAANAAYAVVFLAAGGTATALVGLCTTTATLAVWNLVAPHAGRVATLGVLALTTGAVGLVNFGVLNRVIGARTGARQVPARQPAGSA